MVPITLSCSLTILRSSSGLSMLQLELPSRAYYYILTRFSAQTVQFVHDASTAHDVFQPVEALGVSKIGAGGKALNFLATDNEVLALFFNLPSVAGVI